MIGVKTGGADILAALGTTCPFCSVSLSGLSATSFLGLYEFWRVLLNSSRAPWDDEDSRERRLATTINLVYVHRLPSRQTVQSGGFWRFAE